MNVARIVKSDLDPSTRVSHAGECAWLPPSLRMTAVCISRWVQQVNFWLLQWLSPFSNEVSFLRFRQRQSSGFAREQRGRIHPPAAGVHTLREALYHLRAH